MSPQLLVLGNPLLDLQVRDAQEALEKYKLQANDAILVAPEQESIYDHIRSSYDVTYVAGGAAQNAARAAQFCLPPDSVVYLGSVGDDDLATQLREANKKEGLRDEYQVQPKGTADTGACAVLITGTNRSLVTKLGAAEKFSPSHLEDPKIKALIEEAQFYYVEGFFLTHGLESAMKIAKHAAENGKTFALNLSAPFIAEFFKSQVDEIMPYVDVLFGNDAEAEAFARVHGLRTEPVSSIPAKFAKLPKINAARPRTVVITQGASSTLVADSHLLDVKHYPVAEISERLICDANGAGDALAGAFLAALVAGRDIDEAVAAGHKLARICLGQVGPTFGERQPILE